MLQHPYVVEHLLTAGGFTQAQQHLLVVPRNHWGRPGLVATHLAQRRQVGCDAQFSRTVSCRLRQVALMLLSSMRRRVTCAPAGRRNSLVLFSTRTVCVSGARVLKSASRTVILPAPCCPR
ncbi:MAG: hypothetical protein SNJ69_16255 [Chloroflexaceae bacterium]